MKRLLFLLFALPFLAFGQGSMVNTPSQTNSTTNVVQVINQTTGVKDSLLVIQKNSLANLDMLRYNSATLKWIPRTPAQVLSDIGAAPATGGLYLLKSGGTMTGNLLFTDNTYDIGASGATRPRTGYFGTSIVVPAATFSSTVSNTGVFTSNSGYATKFNSAAGFTGSYIVQNAAGTNRWIDGLAISETGSGNTGSDFYKYAYADDGSVIGSTYVYRIIRSSKAIDFIGTVTAPTFIGALTGNASTATTATNATNSTITDDNSTNATMYPTWVTANTGNLPQKVSSTGVTFNPSTKAMALGGTLTTYGGYTMLGNGPNLYLGIPTTGTAGNVPALYHYSANGTYSWSRIVGDASGLLQWVDGTGSNNRMTLTQAGTLTVAAIDGSTAANGDITIQGTSSATRTTSYVNLQPNGGLVGIGTATPANLLTLSSDLNSAIRFSDVNATAGTRNWKIQTNDNNYGDFTIKVSSTLGGAPNTTVMSFENTGVATIQNLAGTGSRAVLADASGNLSAPVSDRSVKQNIRPAKYGLKEIMMMNPVTFEYKKAYQNYGTGDQLGNIAQDMEKVIPEAVFTTPSTGLKGINYMQFDGIYIKAIQDVNNKFEAKIDSLNTVISTLKKVNKLK